MDTYKRPPDNRKQIQEFFEEEQREIERQSRAVAEEASRVACEKMRLNSTDISSLIHSSHNDFMNYFYSTLTPDIHSVEVNPAGEAAKKGSSSRSSRKKDKKGNKCYQDPWTDV